MRVREGLPMGPMLSSLASAAHISCLSAPGVLSARSGGRGRSGDNVCVDSIEERRGRRDASGDTRKDSENGSG